MHLNQKSCRASSALTSPACFKGHSCVFTLCDCDSNVIPAEPIKSRQADHPVQGCDECCKRLIDTGFKPILHRLDDDVSNTLIKSIKEKKLKCQPVSTCINSNFQSTLHINLEQCRHQLATTHLVPTHSPSSAHTQPSPALTNQPTTLSISPSVWSL